MKHHLIALAAASVLLAACSDKPRGPLEVQGQVFMDRKLPVQFEFLGREKGRVTNFDMDVRTDFSYTLEGGKLVLRIPGQDGKPEEVVELTLDGKRYSGGPLNLYTKDAGDEARIQQIQENTRARAEIAKKLSPKGAPSGAQAYRASTDLEDENNDWATWVAFAWSGKSFEDDELLRMFSRKWNNTQDSFDRQALRAGELERIKQRLSEVRKIEYVRFPWTHLHAIFRGQVSKPVDKEAYDFTQKSFQLIGDACSGSNNVTRSGVRYSLLKDPVFCGLPVADEAVARRIEAARSSKGVELGYTVYAKIAGVEGVNIKLVPVAVDYQVYEQTYNDPRPEELLAEVSHWPYQ